jgi:hypothetical protein
MKRTTVFTALALSAAVLVPVIRADVKTKERTQLKFEGALGGVINRFGGAATNEGVVSTVAVKGNRLSRLGDATGQIIDLSEQKVYKLDLKKKEYQVVTFDQMRQQLKDAQDRAAQAQAKQPSASQNTKSADDSGKQIQFDANVKETGEKKAIAGYDTREVVLTITAHEKDKKIEESGGFIMTSDMWLAPKVAALDEIVAFEQKYFQAVYGQALGMDPQQMGQMMAAYPQFSKMAAEMQTQGKKLQGTPLLTTTTFDSVPSADAAKQSSSSSSSSDSSSSSSSNSGTSATGGLGGMLARRLAQHNANNNSGGSGSGQSGPNSRIMTTTTERLSIEAAASADDVAIPAGFKEKK